MRKILPMMILGLFLGSQTMSVSEARLIHKTSKSEAELNWNKQMQLSKGAVSDNEKEIVNEFLNDYNEAGGVKIDKALSMFLDRKGLNRRQKRSITSIVLDGKLVDQNNKVVKASNVTLRMTADSNDEDDDGQVIKKDKKKKKKDKKAKKHAKKAEKKLKKQNKNKGKKSKKIQDEEIDDALDEEENIENYDDSEDSSDDYGDDEE